MLGLSSHVCKSRRIIELSFFLLLAILIAIQIFSSPFVGMADNGDFPKVTGRLSIGPRGAYEKFIYFTSDYVRSPKYHWKGDVIFSELVPAWLATSILRNITRQGDFDIRYLGALHLCMLLSAYYLLMKLLRTATLLVQVGLTALATLIFSDVMYAAYLNSFYSDVTAFLGILLMVVSALHILRDTRSWGNWIVFCVSTLLFITSKAQHGIWAFFPALLAIVATWRKHLRFQIVGLVLCLLFLSAGALELSITPPNYKAQALFNLIFYKITRESRQPLADLKDLGIPEEEASLIGTTAYDPGSRAADPNWLRDFYAKVGYKSVAKFYLSHPSRAFGILDEDLRSAEQIRPAQIANYRRVDGVPPRTLSKHFCLWSNFRSLLFRLWPTHILVWYILLLVLSTVLLVKEPQHRFIWKGSLVCVLVCVVAILEYGFASLADAIETNRHLFLFQTLTDMSVCFASAYALNLISLGWKQRHARRPAASAGVTFSGGTLL